MWMRAPREAPARTVRRWHALAKAQHPWTFCGVFRGSMVRVNEIVLTSWPIPSEHPLLMPGTVHIWCLDLALPPNKISALKALLAEDELARAARYKFDRHRRRFIACRGQVRRILANYLRVEANRIGFEYGMKGKPALAAPWRKSKIEH